MIEADKMHELFDSMVCGVIITDVNLKFQYMNQSAEALLGYSLQRLKNTSINDIFKNPKLAGFIATALNEMQSQVIREDSFLLKNTRDSSIYVDYAITPMIDGETVTGLLFEISQIDRQMRMARELLITETQATNQSVLRGIAHEIKNPLGGIRGAAQLLDNEFESDSVSEYTQIIISEADRLKNLIDRILGSSKIPKQEVVNIHEVMEHVRLLIESSKSAHIHCHTDYDPSLPDFVGSRDQLVQVFLNVANNAIKALDEKGNIYFKTRIERHFTIKNVSYPLVLKASVIDDGPGIPEDLQDKIFFPMISGNADGTGLGLSIAQSIINRHNGLIEYERKSDKTKFHIYIPLERNKGITT